MAHSNCKMQLCDCCCVLPNLESSIISLARGKHHQMPKLQYYANEHHGRNALFCLGTLMYGQKFLSTIILSEMGILSVQTPFVRRTTGNALIKTSKRLLTKVYEHHDSSVPKKNRLPTNLRENDIMTISNFNVVNTSSLLPTRSDATQCVNEIDALLYTLKANDIVEVQFNASWYPGMIMECNLDDSYSVMWWMDDNSQRFSRQLLNKQLRIPLFTLQNSRTSNTYIDHLWQLASDLAGYLFQKQSIIVNNRSLRA